jgi:hypothetical protein
MAQVELLIVAVEAVALVKELALRQLLLEMVALGLLLFPFQLSTTQALQQVLQQLQLLEPIPLWNLHLLEHIEPNHGKTSNLRWAS